MPELGLTEMQMGWVLSAFVWGYALFQFPGGIFGEVAGPRRALTVAALLWVVLTILTGLVPGQIVTSAASVMVALLALRFLLRVVQAPLFPIPPAPSASGSRPPAGPSRTACSAPGSASAPRRRRGPRQWERRDAFCRVAPG